MVFSLASFVRDWARQEFALVGKHYSHTRSRKWHSALSWQRSTVQHVTTTTVSDGLAASIFRVVGHLPDFTVP